MADSQQEHFWVLRAQAGDREAFEFLLRSIRPSLRRYLYTLVGSDADDLAQDVMLTIYRKIAWLQASELFRPWMYRIASRAAFRHLRKQRRWRQEPLPEEDASSFNSTAVVEPPSAFAGELPELDALPPASRAVLVLHFRESFTLPEIAAVLAISIGTVKSRLAYGLAFLRKKMNAQGANHVAST